MASMRVLVVNVGSSNLKLRLLDDHDALLSTCDIEAWTGASASVELEDFVAAAGRIDVVGHRVVHGGQLHDACLIDPDVRAEIQALVELAPLHQSRALAGIDAIATLLPSTPAVACFDTAFHKDLPESAATYALPASWRHRWGARRYGFHGLSHGYAARRAAEILATPVQSLRTVTCHLGAGASLAAVACGQSVDTTMGFTPLDGLVMATRCGSLDPGLLLWLQAQENLTPAQMHRTLEHQSGLAGLAGGSGDMREVLAEADEQDLEATLAVNVYLHRLRREIAAMAAAMNGLDAVVFTGGIGEHQPRIRAATADGLRFLGVELDTAANDVATRDSNISAPDAAVHTLVITAREDLEIARQARAVAKAKN